MGIFGNKHKAKRQVSIRRDSSGKSAVSLEKTDQQTVSLSKTAQAASVSLSKSGLLGIRGKAILVLDHSGSMGRDYENGNVQTLTEMALGFMLQFSSDESVKIIPFDYRSKNPVTVDLNNYHNVVDEKIWNRNNMGSTNLTAALLDVRDEAEKTDELIYCAIITDGNPDDHNSATQVVCDLANLPVFLKFLSIGSVPYLDQLDNLDDSRRLLDNVNAQGFDNIASITPESFAQAMAEEWDSWIKLATDAGALKD